MANKQLTNRVKTKKSDVLFGPGMSKRASAGSGLALARDMIDAKPGRLVKVQRETRDDTEDLLYAVSVREAFESPFGLTLESIDQFHREVTIIRAELRSRLGVLLRSAPEWVFDSLAHRKRFTAVLNELLAVVSCRIACPTCGNASTVKAVKAGNSKEGVFQFDHVIGGKRSTHGGRGALAPLQLIEPQADKRKKKLRSTP